MNYKIYIYVISLFACAYAITGINFENIIRKNRVKEAKVLMMVFCLALSYLVANFVISFIEYSKII